MRIALLGLFVLLLGTCGSAQTTYPAPYLPAYQEVTLDIPHVLSGRISGLPDSLLGNLKLDVYTSSFSNGTQISEEVALAEDGTFSYPLPVSYPLADLYLQIGELFFEGYVLSGDLHVEMAYIAATEEDDAKLTVTKLSGESADLSAGYLAIYDSIELRPYQYYNSNGITTAFDEDLPLEEKLRKIDSLYQDRYDTEEPALKKAHPLAAEYWRNSFKGAHLYFIVSAYRSSEEPLPADLQKRVLAFVPQVINHEGTAFYRGLYYRHAKRPEDPDGKPLPEETMLEANARTRAAVAQDFGVKNTDLFKIFPSSNDPYEHKAYIDATLPTVTTPWVAAEMAAERDRLAAKITLLESAKDIQATSQTLGDFARLIDSTDYNAKRYFQDNNQSAATLVANLRAAFPGKYLYLDLWATWCGPCVGEFPSSHDLHEAATDLPVEFIYLCAQYGKTTEGKWKELTDKYKLAGTHLLVDRELHDELLSLFNSTGYPTYVLISPDGEMNLNVGRPSGLTREKLREALTK
ncbi:TlpA disulfide reductase family protein [Lewinella sp. 4G2]|uniref:TlpA family protein disulfide reductase n=1 Tax=Lewinella sp. 4G2 TaxID=1803372 RepID=UPI0007B469D6|nr:TlpA disulfide reductase family protein [Lewinella sp. 4G2]OAV44150.1 hypothetical protein A3850_006400 [Lewinella sp. 4G2]